MKFQNLKRKAQTALAATTVAVLSAPAMANTGSGSLLQTITTEISGYKAEILALGAIVVGIAVAFAVIRIGKRGANSV